VNEGEILRKREEGRKNKRINTEWKTKHFLEFLFHLILNVTVQKHQYVLLYGNPLNAIYI
jgi:hypothetical protein